MKHNNQKKAGRLSTYMTIALLAALGFCSNTWAENKVVIQNVSIQAEGEAAITVNLENEDNLMAALQMDIIIPEGLEVNEGSIKFVGDRIDEEDFFLFMQQQADKDAKKVYRILVVPQGLTNFKGNSGALLQFTVTANSLLKPTQEIMVERIVGSDTDAKRYDMANFKVNVSQMVGSFTATSAETDSLLLKPGEENNKKRVSVSLNNTIEVRAMEAIITLPEGVKPEMNEKGEVLFERSSRVPTNLKFSSTIKNNTVKVILSGLTTDILKDNEGEVFAFYVSGDEALEEKTELAVSNVIVANNASNAFDVIGTQKVKIVNMDKVYLAPAQAIVTALNDSLTAVVATIGEECVGVKDSTVVIDSIKAVANQIAEFRQAIKAAYADESLASDYNNKVAPKSSLETAIGQLLEFARQAQKDFDELNAAYAYAMQQLDSLNKKFTDAVDTISTNCPDVKDNEDVKAAEENVKAQIEALKQVIDDAKANGSLIDKKDEFLSKKEGIETAISKMVEDAEQAQKNFETGIESMEDSEEISQIFTLSGLQVEHMQKGEVYIIRYKNGSTKKSTVK